MTDFSGAFTKTELRLQSTCVVMRMRDILAVLCVWLPGHRVVYACSKDPPCALAERLQAVLIAQGL
eukprot:4229305-Amphidinium_carterae.1